MKKTIKLLLACLLFSVPSCGHIGYEPEDLFMLRAVGYQSPVEQQQEVMAYKINQLEKQINYLQQTR